MIEQIGFTDRFRYVGIYFIAVYEGVEPSSCDRQSHILTVKLIDQISVTYVIYLSAPGGTRTHNPVLKGDQLCQLSYKRFTFVAFTTFIGFFNHTFSLHRIKILFIKLVLRPRWDSNPHSLPDSFSVSANTGCRRRIATFCSPRAFQYYL